MISDVMLGVLIAGGFFISALIIQIAGTLFYDWRNHKRRIERIRNEFVLKEKIESFKKIHKIVGEIKRKIINFLVEKEKDKGHIKELIFKLNNEAFLFSNKKTLKEIKEGVELMHSILDNPPKIFENNQEEFEKLANKIADTQVKIIISIRKELNI